MRNCYYRTFLFLLLVSVLQSQDTLITIHGQQHIGTLIDQTDKSIKFVGIEGGNPQYVPTRLVAKIRTPKGVIQVNELNLTRESVQDSYDSSDRLAVKITPPKQDQKPMKTTPRTKLPPDPEIWANVGLGGGTPGPAIMGSISWKMNQRIALQVMGVHSFEFAIFSSTPEESVSSLGLSIGTGLWDPFASSSVFIGAGVVSGFHRGEKISGGSFFNSSPAVYAKNQFSAPGLTVNAQTFVTTAFNVGIGLEAFGCLNQETTIAVLTVSLHANTFE